MLHKEGNIVLDRNALPQDVWAAISLEASPVCAFEVKHTPE
jgi:hypothetical protein